MLYQSEVTYKTQTNFSCTASTPQVQPSLYRNATPVSSPDVQNLTAGYYYYLCNASETANYTQSSLLAPLKVNEGSFTISLSPKLSEGIFFTNRTGAEINQQYNVENNAWNNATWNYNATSKQTAYWINNTGTVPMDFCLKANSDLTCSQGACAGVTISADNIGWNNSTSNDQDNPSYDTSKRLSLSYQKVAFGVSPGATIYLRFWLYVSVGKPSGIYNTTYSVKAVEEGQSC
jgi:hypothetical protein